MAIARTAGVVVPTLDRTVTAASFLGLLVAVNVTIFAVGTLWSRRQVKRVAAERAAQFRGLFKLEPLPPPDDEVQILVVTIGSKGSYLSRSCAIFRLLCRSGSVFPAQALISAFSPPFEYRSNRETASLCPVSCSA